MINGPQWMPANQSKYAVVMLHGYGSNGADLIQLTSLFAPEMPQTAFFSPDAPEPTAMGIGYQWFSDVGGTFLDPDGMKDAATQVEAFLEKRIYDRLGVAPENTILLGFSMGTMVALYTAPRLKKAVAGVVGFSGRLLYEDGLEKLESYHKTPVLLAHGKEDDVVPAAESEEAAKRLKKLDFPVELELLDNLPHSIDQRGVNTAIAFMQKHLGMA